MTIIVSGERPVVTRSQLGAAARAGQTVVVTRQKVEGDLPPPPPTGAIVTTRPVVDAVKRVEGDRVGASLDRISMLEVTVPMVLSVETAGRILSATDEDPIDLALAVDALGEPLLVRG